MSGKQQKRARTELKERIKQLEIGANKGNEEAQISLGYIYCERSSLGPVDLEKSFYWFKRAADQGNAEALMEVCFFYMDGAGVEKDIKLAARYLYAYQKKIASEEYKSWGEAGLDEEAVVNIFCRQHEMRDLFVRRLKEVANVGL